MAAERTNSRVWKGFTLIESLVFLFIFALIAVVLFQVYSAATRLIIESKDRLGATALGNEKMEIIRSVAYDSIGTKRWNGSAWVYGIPPGDLLEEETVSVNTVLYTVHTFVQYADDSFDGQVGGSPNDAIPTDYKRVRITVTWGGGGSDQTVALFGNFSPNGIETASDGGVLAINVLDAAGSGVAGAAVHVVNAASGVDLTAATDSTGNLMLPGAPVGTESYQITVSKNGYYGAATMPPYPTSAYNPIDVHASVAAGVLNQKSIVMDQAATLHIRSQDPFGTSLPNIAFHLTGGRLLGSDPSTNPAAPVYGFDKDSSTDANGSKDFTNESYGTYTLAVSGSQYQFFALDPEGVAAEDAFSLPAGSETTETVVLADKNIGSLIVKTTAPDGTPVSGATIQLSNASLGYDATRTANSQGKAYFPENLPALAPGTYDLKISAAGFQDMTKTVTIGSSLLTQTEQLTAN